MDQVERQLEDATGGPQAPMGTPNPDGPGNPAYRRMQALLAKVQAEEAARARRN